MIRIHETHTQELVPGINYAERNNLSVLDAVVALTVSLNRNFVVKEARFKRLILKIQGEKGKVALIQYTGDAKDMKALLLATFIYAIFRDNMRSQEVMRDLMEKTLGDRDAFQENLVDLQEAGSDWQVLALGVPMELTDVDAMKALYEEKLPELTPPNSEPDPEPAAENKKSAFICEAV